MSTTVPVRLPRVIYDEASDVAPLVHRTVGQQLAYWAELGRAFEANAEASPALIHRLLLRNRLASTDEDDKAAVLAGIDSEIDAQIETLDLKAILQQEHYVEADASGALLEQQPTTT